jgi:hypothetical protein
MDTHSHSTTLAAQLLCSEPAQSVAGAYRLARIVARVLVSVRLRQRRKWCALAQGLSADASVEPRLVQQAIGWLEREPAAPL